MDTIFWQKMFAVYGHYILAEGICSSFTLHFGRRCLLFMDTTFWQQMIAVYGHCILAEMFALYGRYLLAEDICC
jgi:hypothetical protein